MIQWEGSSFFWQGRTATSRFAKAPRRGLGTMPCPVDARKLRMIQCDIWVCLKMLAKPLNPMVLLIIIPFWNGYFIGNIPNIFRQTHIVTWLWHDCDMIVITMGIIIIRIISNTSIWQMPTMTLLCVGHGRVSASRAAGASEAGAAKALSDRIIQHHSSDPHSSGRRNNWQMCHQMWILAEVSSSACWARNPFPASQAHNGRLVAAGHCDATQQLPRPETWGQGSQGRHRKRSGPAGTREIDNILYIYIYTVLYISVYIHIYCILYLYSMQYHQVISGNLAGSDWVFSRGIVFAPHGSRER